SAFAELKARGFGAVVFGSPVSELYSELFELARNGLPDGETKYLERLGLLLDEKHRERPMNLMQDAD
ncbi:MAG: hypothetical protein LBS99_04545, partial [Clostridiales bacterium]|nr:hypothetical protein [Clostridiales bacterium]